MQARVDVANERFNSLLSWVHKKLGIAVELTPLSGDASSKRYYRISGLADAILAMDAPPPDSVARYLSCQALLHDVAIRVPIIHAYAEDLGFALIEDLGDNLYEQVLIKEPKRSFELYCAAWQTIDKLQATVPANTTLPVYDDALLDRELSLFPEWYATHHARNSLTTSELEDYARVCTLLKKMFRAQEPVVVHRDFHSRNLFATDPGPAVIDFSDAVIGPPTYDIASLLRDLYVDLDEEEQLDYLVRHWEYAKKHNRPVAPDFGEHYRQYEWISLQRLVKILGLFVRLEVRDGKSGFQAHLPRCAQLVHAIALRYRDTRPLALMVEARLK